MVRDLFWVEHLSMWQWMYNGFELLRMMGDPKPDSLIDHIMVIAGHQGHHTCHDCSLGHNSGRKCK
jgi:hypothetical protein